LVNNVVFARQRSFGLDTSVGVVQADYLHLVTRRDIRLGTREVLQELATPRVALLMRATRMMVEVTEDLARLDIGLQSIHVEECDCDEEGDSLSGSDHGDVHDFEGNLD
jgi:hypothetical protein